MNQTPVALTPYYYAQLSPVEQVLYDLLLEKFLRFQERVDVARFAVPPQSVVRAFHAVNLDHPEIIWVKWECTCDCRETPGGTQAVTAHLGFHMPQQEAEEAMRQIRRAAEPMISHLKHSGQNDWEKVLWLHDAIIKLADYDSTERGKWEKKECNHSIYGIFVNHLAVCEGYSEAMTYVLRQVGVDCITCQGGDHAWNIVTIDGVSTNLDVTWDDLGNDRGENGVCYRCFGLTTQEMDALHGFSSRFPVPHCQGRELNYHLRKGFTASSLSQLHSQVQEAVRRRMHALEVRLTDAALLGQLNGRTGQLPVWLPQRCARWVARYQLFRPDPATGWVRIELVYR